MMDSLILLFVGTIVGFFGTVVGVGGGFIVVPFLTLVYHVSPQEAVGTSMCIVALNAISGAYSYARQKRIDYRTGAVFSLSMAPGAVLGATLLQMISKRTFDIGFALFLLAIALYTTIKENKKSKGPAETRPEKFVRPVFNMAAGMAISFFVGFYASIAGVGGGLIHVPAMVYLFHYHPYFAIPTSIFILAISSTVAVGSHAMVGGVLWGFVPYLGAGAMIGAQAGGKLSGKFDHTLLLRILVVVIVIAAVRLISRYI